MAKGKLNFNRLKQLANGDEPVQQKRSPAPEAAAAARTAGQDSLSQTNGTSAIVDDRTGVSDISDRLAEKIKAEVAASGAETIIADLSGAAAKMGGKNGALEELKPLPDDSDSSIDFDSILPPSGSSEDGTEGTKLSFTMLFDSGTSSKDASDSGVKIDDLDLGGPSEAEERESEPPEEVTDSQLEEVTKVANDNTTIEDLGEVEPVTVDQIITDEEPAAPDKDKTRVENLDPTAKCIRAPLSPASEEEELGFEEVLDENEPDLKLDDERPTPVPREMPLTWEKLTPPQEIRRPEPTAVQSPPPAMAPAPKAAGSAPTHGWGFSTMAPDPRLTKSMPIPRSAPPRLDPRTEAPKIGEQTLMMSGGAEAHGLKLEDYDAKLRSGLVLRVIETPKQLGHGRIIQFTKVQNERTNLEAVVVLVSGPEGKNDPSDKFTALKKVHILKLGETKTLVFAKDTVNELELEMTHIKTEKGQNIVRVEQSFTRKGFAEWIRNYKSEVLTNLVVSAAAAVGAGMTAGALSAIIAGTGLIAIAAITVHTYLTKANALHKIRRHEQQEYRDRIEQSKEALFGRGG